MPPRITKVLIPIRNNTDMPREEASRKLLAEMRALPIAPLSQAHIAQAEQHHSKQKQRPGRMAAITAQLPTVRDPFPAARKNRLLRSRLRVRVGNFHSADAFPASSLTALGLRNRNTTRGKARV